jgi:hypothetical protein
MSLTKNTILLTTLMASSIAYGQKLKFKSIDFSGSGCSEETASTIISPDGKSMSVLFDELYVEIPQFSGDNDNDELSDDNEDYTSKFNKNVDRKTCLMNIEAKVPKGHKIKAIDLSFDYRGSTFTEEGALTSFKTKLVNFQGPSGRRQHPEKLLGTKRFRQNSDTDFTLSQTRTLPIQSECVGKESISKFALKNIVKAKAIRGQAHLSPEAFIALDSADLKASVKFKVHLEKCNARGSGSDHDYGRGSSNGRDNSRINYQRQRCSRLGGIWNERTKQCRNMRQGRNSRRRR